MIKAKCPQCWDSLPCNCPEHKEKSKDIITEPELTMGAATTETPYRLGPSPDGWDASIYFGDEEKPVLKTQGLPLNFMLTLVQAFNAAYQRGFSRGAEAVMNKES